MYDDSRVIEWVRKGDGGTSTIKLYPAVLKHLEVIARHKGVHWRDIISPIFAAHRPGLRTWAIHMFIIDYYAELAAEKAETSPHAVERQFLEDRPPATRRRACGLAAIFGFIHVAIGFDMFS